MITYRTGEVITVRDRAMKRIVEQKELPVEMRDKLVYIAGPIVKDNEVISCGPTTATRVEPYIYDFVAIARPKLIVGKGPMYENMEKASRDFGVAYGIFPGGCGALAAKKLRVKAHYRPELGMPESVRVFDAKEFGPIAIVIENGRNYLREIEEEARRRFSRLFR